MIARVFIVLCTATLPATGAFPEVYISPDGDDANRGTKSQPLRSLDAARAAVRRTGSLQRRPIGGKFTTREPWNQAAWAREFARSRDMVVEGYLSNDSFFQFDAVVHGLHALVVATRSVLRHLWQPVELSSAAWPQGQAA